MTNFSATATSWAFLNSGQAGAVFHVYDRAHLERIPRRYTVESGKHLEDDWDLQVDEGRYDLWVIAPNGFVREFRGTVGRGAAPGVEVRLEYDLPSKSVRVVARNKGPHQAELSVRANSYRDDGPWVVQVPVDGQVVRSWTVIASHLWYDFTVVGQQFERRFAGRMETGKPGFSDPAI